MIPLDKLGQAYMLAVLNTKEAYSKQSKDKYYDILWYKIGDLVTIKNFDKNLIGMQRTYLISELYD